MPSRIYLDYAAATPVAASVERAMRPYLGQLFANPSSLSSSGAKAREAVSIARQNIASHLGAKPHQIIFTSGATEANNLAIRGVMANQPGKKVLVSAIEHESVSDTAAEFDRTLIPVDRNGQIDLKALEEGLTDEVVLISVIHASNEIGTIQPLRDIAALVARTKAARDKRGIKTPLLFHTDAAQSPQTLDLHVHRLGVDMMTLSAAKIYGPKGVGCLYVNDKSVLKPQLTGGGQELGLRSGTEPVALVVGFGQAMQEARADQKEVARRYETLRSFLIAELNKSQPDIGLNANGRHVLHQIVSLRLPQSDGEALVMALDQAGIEVATGSACAASTDQPSHVLLAIGLEPAEAAGSLRLSFGRKTTEAELKKFVAGLGAFRA